MGYFLSRYKFFRKWRGGRWEYHFIDICGVHMWLQMRNDPEYQWPKYRQPCSVGAPLVETYHNHIERKWGNNA